MLNNKLETLIGFAIKSGHVVFGYDNLCETRKKIKVVLISNDVNEKNKQKILNLCCKKRWVLCLTNDLISELTHRDNCKVVGITDENMANAILKLDNLKLVTEEL